MKLDVTIEIDWIHNGQIDEVVQEKLVKAVVDQVQEKFTDTMKSSVARAADKLVTAKTDQLIYSILEQPVTISDGWNSKIEYDSIYDMVESKMKALYMGKLGTDGKCEKDPVLAKLESYIKTEVTRITNNLDTKISQHARRMADGAMKENKTIQALEAIIPGVTKQ